MSRAGAAERGFTLIELLVVLTIMALVTIVALPHFRSPGEPGLRQVGRDVAAELRTTRLQAMRTGRITELGGDSLGPRLPSGFTIKGDRVVFYPDGRSSGGALELADAGSTTEIAVDWLTGAVQVTP